MLWTSAVCRDVDELGQAEHAGSGPCQVAGLGLGFRALQGIYKGSLGFRVTVAR